jgi:hypothetical protein
MRWSARFNHPIRWGARTLATLHDARDYILHLPKSEQMHPAWQAATKALRQAAQRGGLCLELARISLLQALLGRKLTTSDESENCERGELARDRYSSNQ